MTETKPHATILYHYFYPDDVVSSRHITDLAEGLVERGWHVTALPCNRGCRDESKVYLLQEQHRGVKIKRIWRPRFKQASTIGRVFNAGWMIFAWSWYGLVGKRGKRDVLIVGTDPILSVLVTIPWRVFRPHSVIAHWCYDLYPEAPIADNMFRDNSLFIRILRWMLMQAYQRCDFLVDLGSCMQKKLATYGSRAKTLTLTPWALAEPESIHEPDRTTRNELFGKANLAILYSGNFGQAHSYAEFLALARELRGDSIHFSFACRGNKRDELVKAIATTDTNVSLAGFAPESELEKRLSSCDLHLVSLRTEWVGTVVPSKFFGALAAGRGVLFAGDPSCAIAKWIRDFDVGWIVTKGNIAEVAGKLRELASDPAQLVSMQLRCFQVYHAHFSKTHVCNQWDAELRKQYGLKPAYRCSLPS